MTAAFRAALARALKYEGGFVDHPADPGGATNYGVTQRTYDAHRRRQGRPTKSVRQIEPSEVEAIYWVEYWLAVAADQLPPALAGAVFDAAVHSGTGRALAWQAESGGSWRRLNTHRLRFLTGLSTWPVFGRGWARRIADLTDALEDLDATAAGQPAERLLLVYDEDGREVAPAAVPHDALIRVTPTRIYARPATPEVTP